MSKLFFAILFFTFSRCYEGWEYGTSGNETTTNRSTSIPEKEPDIFFLLLRPFVLSDSAISNSTCFPLTGISDYRKTEWSLRIAALTEKLTKETKTFNLNPVSIAISDCQKLSSVESAALDINPWTDEAPEDDPKDRPMVEVKAVFWQGDIAKDPSSTVKAEHWAGWKKLISEGRNAKSLHYFVLEDEENGFFSSWKNGLDSKKYSVGTVIDQNSIDPTAAGISSRQEIINRDTDNFITWMKNSIQ